MKSCLKPSVKDRICIDAKSKGSSGSMKVSTNEPECSHVGELSDD